MVYIDMYDPGFMTMLSLALLVAYLMVATLTHKKPEEKKVRRIGTWKSKIYPEETGTIEVEMSTSDVDNANVVLSYASTSKFKPNQKITIECECYEDEKNDAFFLRQSEFEGGQYFTLSLKVKGSTGDLVCVGPSDLCEIKFEKAK